MAIQIGYTFHFDFKGTSLLNYFYTPQLKLKYLFIWGFLTIAVAADYKKPIYFETEWNLNTLLRTSTNPFNLNFTLYLRQLKLTEIYRIYLWIIINITNGNLIKL